MNPWVTWQGFRFLGGYDPANVRLGYGTQLRMSLGWRAEDCLFEGATHNGAVMRGHEAQIVRCTFQGLGCHAIVGVGDHMVVKDTTIRQINRGGLINPSQSAVTKFINTHHLLLENVRSEYNMGYGLWLDFGNVHATIRRCTSIGNVGRTQSGKGRAGPGDQ